MGDHVFKIEALCHSRQKSDAAGNRRVFGCVSGASGRAGRAYSVAVGGGLAE